MASTLRSSSVNQCGKQILGHGGGPGQCQQPRNRRTSYIGMACNVDIRRQKKNVAEAAQWHPSIEEKAASGHASNVS